MNVLVVEGDSAGQRALERDDIRYQIRKRFGDEVLATNGSVRRDRLARLVFGDDAAHRAARHDLEAITHPAIAADLRSQLDQARRNPDLDIVLLDAAVLLEAGWNSLCDALVYIDAPDEQRTARVAAGRRWSSDELQSREASQLPLERKRAAADCVIDNSGPLEAGGQQLLKFIRRRFHILPDRTLPTTPPELT
jgi:dephospho-CoA kinase